MSTLPEPLRWESLDPAAQRVLLQRPAISVGTEVTDGARQIIERVRNGGDTAVRQLTHELDGVDIADPQVSEAEFHEADAALSAEAIAAIDAAIANVARFHAAQRSPDIDLETVPGVRCQRIAQPLAAVGLYVPAGSAPLPSAAIMLAVPAALAGCERRVLCTPPRPDGRADPAVLVAARRAGVDEVWKIGGAQAIAALAYGTNRIAPVAKIFGPGNAWVTAAKTLVASDAGAAAIDMPAGPSEVLVIADDTARPDFVAADLLSQAEHGEDSQVVLLTTSVSLAERVRQALAVQLAQLPRADIARAALRHARLIICTDLDTCVAVSNDYAPEHLIVQTSAPRTLLGNLRNAGSVFLGPWTPESVGDYCSGTNHVLPTYGAARAFSGLGVEQFMRFTTVQELTADGLRTLAPTVTELARLEGLEAHARAVTQRLAPQKVAEA